MYSVEKSKRIGLHGLFLQLVAAGCEGAQCTNCEFDRVGRGSRRVTSSSIKSGEFGAFKACYMVEKRLFAIKRLFGSVAIKSIRC
jgi:hypothetical protein